MALRDEWELQEVEGRSRASTGCRESVAHVTLRWGPRTPCSTEKDCLSHDVCSSS